MNESLKSENDLIISYLTLRKAIGLLGIVFPFVLSVGAIIIFRRGLQPTISDYYHTDMGDVFVGILFVIGFFLISYRGYERADSIAGTLACIFAVGVALFPTSTDQIDMGIIGKIHLFFAAFLFLTLIYFSLFLFTKTDPDSPPTRKKLQRNMVYKACGYVMSICILLIGILFLFEEALLKPIEKYNPVFWLETVTVVAFGISWLTKGEAVLADED